MKISKYFCMVLVIMNLLILNSSAKTASQDKDANMVNCPMHQKHMDALNKRGNKAMGFSQQKTSHHFYLKQDGGVIEVSTNSAKNKISQNQIRQHLMQISQMFGDGNFSIPFAVHAQVPPGVEVLKRLKAAINYQYQETPLGGRVNISTNNPEALTAIHEFLRFQINDHETGDSLSVVAP